MLHDNPYNSPVHESIMPLAGRVLLLQILVALSSLLLDGALVLTLKADEQRSLLLGGLAAANMLLQTVDAAFLIFIVLRWVNTAYIFTPDSIIVRSGILKLHETIYKLDRITSIEVHQGLWGKLFNFGTLSFYSRFLKQEAQLVNIPHPEIYADTIRAATNKSVPN